MRMKTMLGFFCCATADIAARRKPTPATSLRLMGDLLPLLTGRLHEGLERPAHRKQERDALRAIACSELGHDAQVQEKARLGQEDVSLDSSAIDAILPACEQPRRQWTGPRVGGDLELPVVNDADVHDLRDRRALDFRVERPA